jgi:hypothetical protein
LLVVNNEPLPSIVRTTINTTGQGLSCAVSVPVPFVNR